MCMKDSTMVDSWGGLLGWTPEIIAGRLKLDKEGMTISHETIYQYIYHPETENR